jgi:hypothetical protein
MMERDDFPDRLKKGCASRRECIVLAQNARTRLIECREYLGGEYAAGTRTRYHTHWRGCAYEETDYRRALGLLYRWQTTNRVVPVSSGQSLGLVHESPESPAK